MEPSSVMPSARSGHASAQGLGDTFFVFGGINDSGYLGDLFMYNLVSNQWIEINTNVLPPGRTNACMQFMYPILIIYGGENGSGYLNDLWLLDYQYSYFTELSNENKVPAMTEHQCLLDAEYNLYIFGGRVSPFQQNDQIYVNVASEYWFSIPSPIALQLSSAGTRVFNSTFAIIGGNQIDSALSAITLYIISVGIGVTIDYLPVTVTSHAIAHAGRSIYVFGGTLTMGNSFFDEVGTSNFYNVTNEYFDCSIGYAGDNCTICLPGTYGSILNSKACTPCPPGTYSSSYGVAYYSQCTPCAHGTFADLWGSTMCKDCDNPADCHVGSTAPVYTPPILPFAEIQPLAYDDRKTQANAAILNLEFAILAVLVLTCIVYFFLKKFGIFQTFDIFAERHVRKYYEDPFKTVLGGVMTLIFALAALIFIGSPIILYSMANIVETKTLVPVFTLDNQEFTAAEGFMSMKMYNYGGRCGDVNNNCLGYMDIYTAGLTADTFEKNCYTEVDSCVIKISCTNCTMDPVSLISLTVFDYLVYTTGIQVQFGFSSSIPDSNLSAIELYVASPQGQVFNGLNPTVFKLSLFPSVRIT